VYIATGLELALALRGMGSVTRGAARASPHLLLFPRCLNNAQTMSRVPDFYFSEKTRAETAYCSPANVRARQASDRPPQKKRNRVAVPRIVSAGKVIEGEPLMPNVSVRPQPAAVAAVSAFAATAGKSSSDEILVEQIAAGSKPAMHALFARRRLPRTF
jgi:hypothetical protein